MVSEKISIIIPVYNSEKTIARTLQAVLTAASTFRNTASLRAEPRYVEIIAVDDGSTDNTKNIVLGFPTVKYFFQPNAGPAAARNCGALEARGDILFFTDADCLPHSDWLEMMMPHFYKPNVAVVSGSYGIANPQNRLSLSIHQEIIFRHRVLMPEFPSFFGSYNFAIQKSIFEKVGGFDQTYRDASGEDNDLSYKISSQGYKIYFAKDALVDHFHPESLRQYLRDQYRHGFWRLSMYRKHPRMVNGDGYTFWKDSVEVCLVFASYGALVLIFLGFFKFAIWILSAALAGIFLINIYFGIKMLGQYKDGLFFSDVMILRAFARANGFLAGIFSLLETSFLTSNNKDANNKRNNINLTFFL